MCRSLFHVMCSFYSYLLLSLFFIISFFFFFNDPATTEIYTLSLHDALPISGRPAVHFLSSCRVCSSSSAYCTAALSFRDRKSTRLNSSHLGISYAVFCLKKKK